MRFLLNKKVRPLLRNSYCLKTSCFLYFIMHNIRTDGQINYICKRQRLQNASVCLVPLGTVGRRASASDAANGELGVHLQLLIRLRLKRLQGAQDLVVEVLVRVVVGREEV